MEQNQSADAEQSDPSRTSMHAEYPIINHRAQGEEIKHVGKVGPNVWRAVVLSHAFRIEAVGLFASSTR